MRLNRVATAVAAVSAGLTAAAVVRSRTAAHRRPVPAAVSASARPAVSAPAAATSTTTPAAAPPAQPDATPETGVPVETAHVPVETAHVPVETAHVPVEAAAEPVGREAVVLAFVRPGTAQPAAGEPTPAEPGAAQPTAPVRCGDTGGRTKAGAPCGARAGAGGRCRHHPVAA